MVEKELIDQEEAKANEALKAALPALEMAAEALNVLDKKDVTELRTFMNPP